MPCNRSGLDSQGERGRLRTERSLRGLAANAEMLAGRERRAIETDRCARGLEESVARNLSQDCNCSGVDIPPHRRGTLTDRQRAGGVLELWMSSALRQQLRQVGAGFSAP